MKKENILSLCIFTIGLFVVSDVLAAASVRSLGGSGTYSSASVASSAGSKSSSGTKSSAGSTSAALRGGSVRVTSGSGQSAKNTTITSGNTSSAGRAASLQRFSLGKFLGGGTSVSGGSSIRPQGPNDDGYDTDGSFDSGLASDLRTEIEKVREELYKETDVLHEKDTILEEEKQNVLVPKDDGYIIVDENTNEIYIDVDALLGDAVDVSGKEDIANKITSLDDADAENVKYPSAMAVKTAIDTKVDTGETADQALQGDYEVTGTLKVPTQPLP